MIGVVLWIFLLGQGGNRVRHKIDDHDVNLVFRRERQHRQASQKHERLHHLELGSLGITAVAQNDAGPENCDRDVRKKLPDHVLRKFFGTGVGIVVRPLPID